MTQEFDTHATIKALADARIRCPEGFLAFKGESNEQWLCPHKEHGYEGYYVPFELLRVIGLCPDECNCEPEHHTGCGWVPEPDVEKAEFRTLLVLARYDPVRAQGVLADISTTGAKGLALRAAIAWMKREMIAIANTRWEAANDALAKLNSRRTYAERRMADALYVARELAEADLIKAQTLPGDYVGGDTMTTMDLDPLKSEDHFTPEEREGMRDTTPVESHWVDCWRDGGPSHYECAVAFIERLLGPSCLACEGKGGFNQFAQVPVGGTATGTLHYFIMCNTCSGTGKKP